MKNIAIVYWSGTGNTEAMANALRTAVTEAGAEAALIPAEAFAADQVAAFDALAFGCPAMGAENLELLRLGRRSVDARLGGPLPCGRSRPGCRKRHLHRRAAGGYACKPAQRRGCACRIIKKEKDENNA